MKSSLHSQLRTLSVLSSFQHKGLDLFLNPLGFLLQIAAMTRKFGVGKSDNVVVGLQALSQHINSSRYILRFLMGASNLNILLNGPIPSEPSSLINNIRIIQRILNVFYNIAELPAYVANVAPMITSGLYDGDKFGRISCVCWFLNILLEFICMIIQRKQRSPKEFRWGLLAITCDLLLSLNWSLHAHNQFLAPWQILTIGTISSLIVFVNAWGERVEEYDNERKQKKL